MYFSPQLTRRGFSVTLLIKHKLFNSILTSLLMLAVGLPVHALTLIETKVNGTQDTNNLTISGLKQASAIKISPDGKNAYATGFLDNSVVVFTRDVNNGKLTFVQAIQDGVEQMQGLKGANDVTISASGKHVYVASRIDNAVVAFTRNPTNGQLTLAQLLRNGEMMADGTTVITGLAGATSVAVSEDRLYVTGVDDNALTVFARDPTTGFLTALLRTQQNGVNNISGLSGASAVALSPDNNFIYVASGLDNAVVVFNRNPSLGELGFLQTIKEGVGGVTGLLGAYQLSVSPDGNSLYVASNTNPDNNKGANAGTNSSSVVAFIRNADGTLSNQAVYKNGVNNVSGLSGARGIMAMNDRVYVAGVQDSALVAFTRNPDGSLTFKEVVKQGVNGITLLDQVTAVNVFEGQVYAAALVSNAINVFSNVTADLEVTMTDGQQPNTPVAISDNLTYTITVTNKGASNATAVKLVDTLPADTSFVSATPATCVHQSGVVTCDLGNLALNATTTATVVVKTPAAVGTGKLTNKVAVSAAEADNNMANNTAEFSNTLQTSVPSADVQVSVITNPNVSNVNVGSAVSFEVSVTNNGPDIASNVILTNTLPNGFTFVSASETNCTTATTVVTCPIAALANAGLKTITINTKAPTAAVAGTVTFKATVSNSAQRDAQTANNSFNKDLTVAQINLDLAVLNEVATPTSVAVNNKITYKFNVVNSGTNDATNALLTATLPTQLAFSKVEPAECKDNAGKLSCDFGTMSVGKTIPVSLEVTGIQTGLNIPLAFNITANGTDTNPANNTKTVMVNVTGAVADLVVTIQESGNPVEMTKPFTYTITTVNNGPYPTRVKLDGTVSGTSASVGVPKSDKTEDVCSGGTNFTCNLILLPPGEKREVKLEITPTGLGIVKLSATASSIEGYYDPTSPNTQSKEVSVGNVTADIGVEVIATPTPVFLGNNLTYKATVKNNGPSQATGVVFNQSLPSGVTLVSAQADQGLPCTEMSGTINCNIGSLSSGQDAVVIVAVTPQNIGKLSTTVTASSEMLDTDSANNNKALDADVTQTVANLTLTGTVAPEPVLVENILTYSFVIKNLGADTATQVSLLNTLPDNVNFVSAIVEPTNKGTCTRQSNIVACSIGSLLKDTETATVKIDVKPTLAGNIVNSATVRSQEADSDIKDNTVTLASRVNNPATLSSNGTISNGVDGVQGLIQVNDLASSPDDLFLYAVGLGSNSLVTFKRHSDGSLEQIQVLIDGSNGVDGLSSASGVTVSPDGKNVYVTGFTDNAVAVFSRNLASGTLNFVELHRDSIAGVDGLAGAFAVTASDKFVYVASVGSSGVAAFSRDATTGKLTFIQALKNGAGASGLGRASELTLSPDATQLYVVSGQDDTLSVFSSDPSTGKLTFAQNFANGQNGVQGLDSASGVAISPTGTQLYVTGGGIDDALSIFNRDPATGKITYSQTLRNKENGVQYLNGAYGVAVSPKGEYVYVSSTDDSSLTIFSRDATTGQLRYVDALKNGMNGINGLGGARAVIAVGGYVYVAGFTDNSIASFRIASSDLELSLTRNNDTPKLGDKLVYTLTLQNKGQDRATDSAVQITLPTDVEVVSSLTTLGSCDTTATLLTCSIGTLDMGASALVTVTLKPTQAGALRFSASASASQYDPTLPNEVIDNADVLAVADLQVTQLATPSDIAVGGELTFTSTIQNTGPNTATNVIAVNTLPNAATLMTAKLGDNASICTVANTLLTCPIGSLESGKSVDLVITVSPTTAGSLVNSVTVTSDTADPTEPNVAQATVTVRPNIIEELVDNTGKNLNNYTIALTGAVSGGSVSGTIVNQGLLSNVSILAGTVVTGGGALSGTITNAGIIDGAQLLSDTVINGGVVRGQIFGFPDKPGTIVAQIDAGTRLSNVIIGVGSVVSPNIILGENVKFANASAIPVGLDLTAAFPTLPNAALGLTAVDLNADVINDQTLLQEINALAELRDNGLAYLQLSNGVIFLATGTEHLVLTPLSVTQAKPEQTPGIVQHPDGSVSFVTESRREIVAQPAVEDVPALQTALQQLGLNTMQMNTEGTLKIPVNSQMYYVARPDRITTPASAFEPLGLLFAASPWLKNNALAVLHFMETSGELRRQQVLYPTAAHPSELWQALRGIPGASAVTFNNNGTVTVKVNHQTYTAVFDYVVQQGAANNVPQMLFIPDQNADGTEDIRMIYPNGDRQIMYLVPQPAWITELPMIPEMQSLGLSVTETEAGNLLFIQDTPCASSPCQVSTSGIRSLHKVTNIQQVDETTPMNVTIHADGSASFITDSGRKITTQPLMQDFTGLQTGLQAWGLQVNVEDNGNFSVFGGNLQFKARPALISTLAPLSSAVGVYLVPSSLPNVSTVLHIFRDDTGTKRQQWFYPAAQNPQSLYNFLQAMPKVQTVALNNDGSIQIAMGNSQIRGLLAYELRAGGVPTGSVQFVQGEDMNGDGLADYWITYENGEKQMMLQLLSLQ